MSKKVTDRSYMCSSKQTMHKIEGKLMMLSYTATYHFKFFTFISGSKILDCIFLIHYTSEIFQAFFVVKPYLLLLFIYLIIIHTILITLTFLITYTY